MATELWAIALVLFGSFCGSIGAGYFKRCSVDFNLNPLKQIRNKNLIIGVLAYGIGSVFGVLALRGGDLSTIYPFVSSKYVFVCFVSIKFLKESMNKIKWLGILIIIIGTIFIGLSS